MDSTAPSHSSFNVGLPGPCEHKANIGCMLTALPCCCSCADRRPHAAAYPMYVDGQGMRMKGRRWQRYCRKCYDFWQSLLSDSEASPDSTPPITLTSDTSTNPDPISPDAHMPRANNGHARRFIERSLPVEFPLSNDEGMPQLNDRQLRSSDPRHRRRQNNADHGHPASAQPSERQFPLGTREDVQQDDYVSPIFGMFNRAWGRYRDAEEARQVARQVDMDQADAGSRTQQPQPDEPRNERDLHRSMEQLMLQSARAEIERNVRVHAAAQDVQNGINTALRNTEDLQQPPNLFTTHENNIDRALPSLPSALNPLTQPFSAARSQSLATGVVRSRRSNFHTQFYSNPFDPPMRALGHRRFTDSNDDPSTRISAIDRQRSRPEPSRPEDLKVDFGCKSCQEQKIDSISLPCMHASMCHWCAEIWKEACRTDDGRFDRSLWTCPMCRRQISEIRRFYI